MEVLFLGTGGVNGIPAWSCECKACTLAKKGSIKNQRLRPAISITSKGGYRIVVDTGPDFRNQMLKYKINKIDLVLITHDHPDHTACLYELNVEGNICLSMPKSVLQDIQRRGDICAYLKKRNSGFKFSVFKPQSFGSIHIDSVKLLHAKDVGRKPPCYGYIFEENDLRLAYLSDFSEIVELEKLQDIDLMICDGAVMKPRWGHAGIEGGIKLFKKIKPKRMLFTHIAHRMPPHNELDKYVKKFGNIGIAYDGMKVSVGEIAT